MSARLTLFLIPNRLLMLRESRDKAGAMESSEAMKPYPKSHPKITLL